MSHASQSQRILRLLEQRQWVSLPEILALGIASHTRRLSDLREGGYEIECESTWKGRERHTRYRLKGQREMFAGAQPRE